MARFHYSVSFGLAGCYLPDSHGGVYEGTTRKELAELIRIELDCYDLPKSLIRQVSLNRIWHLIKRHGSSSVHFELYDSKGNVLSFNGLTEEEYARETDATL